MPTPQPSPTQVHRRTLLQIAGLATAGSALTAAIPPTIALADGGDFATILERRRQQLIGSELDGSLPAVAAARELLSKAVAQNRALLNPDPAATDVFSDQPLTSGSDFEKSAKMSTTFTRLANLALGVATPGLVTTGEQALLDRILAALTVLSSKVYHAGARPVGNWFQWEIGVPLHLCSLLVTLGDKVPAQLRSALLQAATRFTPNANYRGTGTSPETGANRVNKSFNAVLRGALAADASLVTQGRDALSDTVGQGKNSVFGYVTSGDGFYADGSFIQHGKIPYVGQYGASAIDALGPMFAILQGTAYAITDPKRSVIFDAVEKSFAPFMWNGRLLDVARGRAVSRQINRDYHTGAQVIRGTVLLATAVPRTYRERYHSLVKGWIQRCSEDYLGIATLPQIAAVLPILADPGVVAADEPINHLRFPAQERSVHRRRGWLYTVATSSTRIGRYEWGNSENNEGWYQGDGFGYLNLTSDQDHFADEYWPTLNPYRLPGTIVSDVERENGAASGTGIPSAFEKFSGGVELGPVGIVGASQLNFDKTLSAKQSWFMLEDRIVILAGGITSTVDQRITSAIEHRNLGESGRGVVARYQRGRLPGKPGESIRLRNADWFHLNSVGGYILLTPTNLEISRERRSGKWSRIASGGTTSGDDTEYTREYFTADLDLGRKPTDASFAYALVPLASAEQTRRVAARQETRILANSATAQVIRHRDRLLGNFFAPATTRRLSADAPCSVIAQIGPDTVSVAVSDPSRTTGTVTITLPGVAFGRTRHADDGIKVSDSTSGAVVTAELTGSAAATRLITWRPRR